MADAPSNELEKTLGELYRARDRSPGDPSVLRQIQVVRDQLTSAALDRLRPLDRVVQRVLDRSPETPAEAYVVDQCVDGVASLDVILDRSTLGRHRTAQALEALLRAGIVELAQARERRSIPPRSAFGGPRSEPSPQVDRGAAIVVGEATPTQSALTRTMTRAALHGIPGFTAARLLGAASGSELVEIAVRERATLLVTSFQLPGFDALEALRQLRARGRTIPTLVLVERLDAAFVQPKLPEGAATLARPFDKPSLQAAISAVLTAAPKG